MTSASHQPGLDPDGFSELLEAVDSEKMLDAVLAQPQHLREALERARRVPLPRVEAPGGVLTCAMGGSAIGADLAAAAIGARARRPLRTVRDYRLDPWVGPETMVVCASYSGDTEETLACFAQAKIAGSHRVAITTGGELGRAAAEEGVPVIPLPRGLQPRAAVCYLLGAVLVCAERAGATPSLDLEVRRAADHLARLGRRWGPDTPNLSLPMRLADTLAGRLTVVYGSEETAPIAARWKAQFNENAKAPAFSGILPEANHNEVCAWPETSRLTRSAAVFLRTAPQAERMHQRIELTADFVRSTGGVALMVEGEGSSPVERLLSLVLLGDLVSVFIAALGGTDPSPVAAIENFKRALAQREPLAALG